MISIKYLKAKKISVSVLKGGEGLCTGDVWCSRRTWSRSDSVLSRTPCQGPFETSSVSSLLSSSPVWRPVFTRCRHRDPQRFKGPNKLCTTNVLRALKTVTENELNSTKVKPFYYVLPVTIVTLIFYHNVT